MTNMMDCLKLAVEAGASDLFIIAGGAASIKAAGSIRNLDDEKLMPPQTKQMISEIYELADRSIEPFLESGDDDFSFAVPKLARFRVNTYRQRGSLAAVIRVVSFSIPDWRTLHIPEQVVELAAISSGMILVTGTAGSGKSTTQACLIDRINQMRKCHIVTLEDPIEFLHRNNKSIVSQREIAIDTADYLSALRACLRQSPDVILLGEMRDRETIQTTMTAAETGHLVIATLHTSSAVSSVDRIIDSFPATQQEQIRTQLSMVLRTVVSQKLLPDKNGGQMPAYEIMHMTNAIRSMIRENKSYQIDSYISSGASEGMISMDQSIYELYRKDCITKETALEYSEKPEQMKRRIGL